MKRLVLVLLVVPALLIVQADMSQHLAAFRRAVRRGRLRGYLRAAVVVLAALFAVLLVPALVAGEGYGAAFAWYALASATALGAIWIIAAIRLRRAAGAGA